MCKISNIFFYYITPIVLDNRNWARLPMRILLSINDHGHADRRAISRSLTCPSREFLSITAIGNEADTGDRKAIRCGTRTRRAMRKKEESRSYAKNANHQNHERLFLSIFGNWKKKRQSAKQRKYENKKNKNSDITTLNVFSYICK